MATNANRYSQEQLTAVNQLCKQRGIYHINDEAYEYFVYDDRQHYSPAAIPGADQHTISLFSLSKAYGMAGWRSGYMMIPEHLEVAVKKIQDTNVICPPVVTQVASIAAMQQGRSWCAERIAPYQHIRDIVVRELQRMKIPCRFPRPTGSFYSLLQVDTDRQDVEIVAELIRDFGVGVMPGSTFGIEDRCCFRIAYGALDADTVAEGMERLTRGLTTLT